MDRRCLRRWSTAHLSLGVMLLSAAGPAEAQHPAPPHHPSLGCYAGAAPRSAYHAHSLPPPHCPAPAAPGTPGEPGEPGRPALPTPPAGPEPTPEPSPAAQDAFASAPEAGTEAGPSFAPNMFGDFFGSRGTRLVVVPPPIFVPGTPGSQPPPIIVGGLFRQENGRGFAGTFDGPPSFFPALRDTSGQLVLPVTFQTPPGTTNFGSAISEPFVASGPVRSADGRFPLLVNGEDQQAVLAEAVRRAGPGGVLAYLDAQSGATPLFTNNALAGANIETNYQYTPPAVPGTPDQFIIRSPIVLDVPNPAAGGVVGRTKLSEDNNPLPRDRVFFAYDYFNSVPLTANDVNVDRFSPGFEKTFFDGRTSVQVRIPFASTLSSDIVADGITDTGKTEFGNVNLTFKALAFQGPVVAVAGGFGVGLPTADDTRVSLADGTPVVRIRNEAVILTPYAAVLLTPNDRLFVQSWVQVGFDVNGNPVDGNPEFTGLRPVGRINDQALLQVDTQVGYWVVRSHDPCRYLHGLAPFLELHWNTALGQPDFIRSGGFLIGDTSLDNFQELNLTAGIVSQIGDNFYLSLGAVFPLFDSPDRTFDYQLGVRGNLFFGRTARYPTPGTGVSSF